MAWFQLWTYLVSAWQKYREMHHDVDISMGHVVNEIYLKCIRVISCMVNFILSFIIIILSAEYTHIVEYANIEIEMTMLCGVIASKKMTLFLN